MTGSAWAQRERVRLEELRLEGVELRARILLDSGEGADLVAELGAHVAEHPWREPAWELLARALYRAGRRADALAALRRARAMLVDQLGPTPAAACSAWRRTSSTGPFPPKERVPPGPVTVSGSARAPPWIWPAPSPWRVATPSSAPGATVSPPSVRRNARETSP